MHGQSDNIPLYQHYINYLENAASQGVSTYGAGSAEIEAARVAIISKPNYKSTPYPNKTFSVNARILWNPSDFAIQAGETYNISVDSIDGTWNDGNIVTTANGYTSYFNSVLNCYFGFNQCRSYLKHKRRLKTANWMSLVCGIGEYTRPLTSVKPGDEQNTQFLQLDDSIVQETLFFVGIQLNFTAKHTGQLICFANDAYNLYWNNVGVINVIVVRTSWPPTNTTYYEELYLPACDSAIARYSNEGNFTDGLDHQIPCNPNG